MKHDLFEFSAENMTFADKAYRVIFLCTAIAVLIADLFFWRA
jgi:hypothetical protein